MLKLDVVATTDILPDPNQIYVLPKGYLEGEIEGESNTMPRKPQSSRFSGPPSIVKHSFLRYHVYQIASATFGINPLHISRGHLWKASYKWAHVSQICFVLHVIRAAVALRELLLLLWLIIRRPGLTDSASSSSSLMKVLSDASSGADVLLVASVFPWFLEEAPSPRVLVVRHALATRAPQSPLASGRMNGRA
jgi:hypothetical protein